MRRLYILYDARCGLCSWARRWLAQQPAFLELTFIPAGSERAVRLFPGLSHPEQVEELVVVGDDGGVYRSSRAWIMCLYALQDYREWALRLAHPALLPMARRGFALIPGGRGGIPRGLALAGGAETAEPLRPVGAPACTIGVPS